MPRQARLDVLGALHHIIVRGINKAKIFDIDIVAMPAVVGGIQYFELDRENGEQLMTKQTLVKYQNFRRHQSCTISQRS